MGGERGGGQPLPGFWLSGENTHLCRQTGVLLRQVLGLFKHIPESVSLRMHYYGKPQPSRQPEPQENVTPFEAICHYTGVLI